MGWIIFLTVLAAIWVGLAFGRRAVSRQDESSRAFNETIAADRYAAKRRRFGPELAVIAAVKWAVIGAAVLATVANCVHKVDNGHVGLVYSFGAITGQRGDGHGGIVFTLPWQDIQEANVQIQREVPKTTCTDGTPNCLDAASNESQDVFVVPSINVHVNAGAIQSLYRTVGPNYMDILVAPRVAQVTKEETAKYKSTEIIPNRETLRATITKRLQDELSADSISVDDFLLTDVHFSPDFNKAIEAKVTAEQTAQTEQNNVAVKKAQADQAVAEAQGKADAAVVTAKGEADANNLITSSITPQLIQYETVQKLAPNVKVIMIPAGNGMIFDMGTLVTDGTTDTGS